MKTTATEREEMQEHLAGQAAFSKARQLLATFETAMLLTKTCESGGFDGRPVRLQGNASDFRGTLWLFTDDRSRKVREIRCDPHASLVFQDEHAGRYLQFVGTATVVSDPVMKRNLYTSNVKTWFSAGLHDPNLTLICFKATGGAFWDARAGTMDLTCSSCDRGEGFARA